jgi:methionyl aminopeptidase
MTIESHQDLLGLMHIGRIVGLALRAMEEGLRPGMTTAELDALADDVLKHYGARSAPRITYNFPGVTCISLNEEAAHGIPGERVVRPGDLVKLDVSAECQGYFADAAYTVAVPPIGPRQRRLCEGARAAFDAGLAAVRVDRPLNGIGRAADAAARRHGFRVVRELPGHGLGRALHESPRVPMVFEPEARTRLTDGLVITIEPHVAAGSARLVQDADGWTLKTRDGGWVAAYEHTVVVTKDKPILVTAL